MHIHQNTKLKAHSIYTQQLLYNDSPYNFIFISKCIVAEKSIWCISESFDYESLHQLNITFEVHSRLSVTATDII